MLLHKQLKFGSNWHECDGDAVCPRLCVPGCTLHYVSCQTINNPYLRNANRVQTGAIIMWFENLAWACTLVHTWIINHAMSSHKHRSPATSSSLSVAPCPMEHYLMFGVVYRTIWWKFTLSLHPGVFAQMRWREAVRCLSGRMLLWNSVAMMCLYGSK